jgi:hypothetical protein
LRSRIAYSVQDDGSTNFVMEEREQRRTLWLLKTRYTLAPLNFPAATDRLYSR